METMVMMTKISKTISPSPVFFYYFNTWWYQKYSSYNNAQADPTNSVVVIRLVDQPRKIEDNHRDGLNTINKTDGGEESFKKDGSGPSRDHVRRLPGAIIIGVKKGGTRALLEYLRLHPDVKAPGPEVHYFDKFYKYGLEWYRSQMVPTWPWQITVEKTPSYFITREAPARIFAMNPNIKLIVVVRNPVTRALSDYTQNVSKRPGMPSFEEMAFVTNRSNTSSFHHGISSPAAPPSSQAQAKTQAQAPAVNTSWGAIKIGLYHKHVRRWLKFFPLNSIHFVDGQCLITHPAEETSLVERFLRLEPFISEKHFFINKTYRSTSVNSDHSSLVDNGHWSPPPPFPCLNRLGSGRRGPLRCLGKTKGRKHPDVQSHLLKKLKEFYEPHNEKFFSLIKRRFDW